MESQIFGRMESFLPKVRNCVKDWMFISEGLNQKMRKYRCIEKRRLDCDLRFSFWCEAVPIVDI